MVDLFSPGAFALRGSAGGERYLAWQAPLHTGEAFGMRGRIVVCIAGLAPALLLVTGVLMWLRLRRARHALARRMNS